MQSLLEVVAVHRRVVVAAVDTHRCSNTGNHVTWHTCKHVYSSLCCSTFSSFSHAASFINCFKNIVWPIGAKKLNNCTLKVAQSPSISPTDEGYTTAY